MLYIRVYNKRVTDFVKKAKPFRVTSDRLRINSQHIVKNWSDNNGN